VGNPAQAIKKMNLNLYGIHIKAPNYTTLLADFASFKINTHCTIIFMNNFQTNIIRLI